MRCFIYKALTELIFWLGTWRSKLYSSWHIEGSIRHIEGKLSHQELVELANSGAFVECPLCCQFFKPELGRKWLKDEDKGEDKEVAVEVSGNL